MVTSVELLAIGLVALTVSVASPLLILPVLRRHQIIDVPGARSSHTVPVVRGAGLAPALGVAAAWSCVAIAGGVVPLGAATMFGVSLACAAVGFTEDVHGLSVKVRLALQLAIGVSLGLIATELAGRSLWWGPLVAIGFAGYVNAANFMDGVDSISALHGVVAGGYFCLLGGLVSQPALQIVGVACAAVFAGFAPWNLTPRLRVFLGDVGSYLLGALVAGCATVAFLAGSGLIVSVAPLLPYVADTAYTLLCRAFRSEPVTQPHRSHVYQRLTQLGWSHVQSGGTVALASVLCCSFALLSQWSLVPVTLCALSIALVLTVYLTLPWVVSRSRTDRASV